MGVGGVGGVGSFSSGLGLGSLLGGTFPPPQTRSNPLGLMRRSSGSNGIISDDPVVRDLIQNLKEAKVIFLFFSFLFLHFSS